MESKRCSKCKEVKALSEFSKDKNHKDGLRSYCKSCQKIYEIEYKKTINGKIAHKLSDKSYRIRHPNRIKAINAVNRLVQNGTLRRPDTLRCYYCPVQAQEYHHWHGYEPEHWLDVVSVCKKCHHKHRRKIA